MQGRAWRDFEEISARADGVTLNISPNLSEVISEVLEP